MPLTSDRDKAEEQYRRTLTTLPKQEIHYAIAAFVFLCISASGLVWLIWI